MEIYSNILDPIQDTLDPEVFDNAASREPRLKATIAAWVKNKVVSVLQANGYSGMDSWLRLILTGSLTTYQWAADSDFDVSLWCSLDVFEEFDRAALIKIVLEQLDGEIVPGTTHPLQCFVVDVTKFKDFSQTYQPGIRSAYDIDKMEWMVPPERERVRDVRKTYPDVFNSALAAASKMRSLLQYQPEAARAYWKYLHKRRRSDMMAGRGDYADSNIIYKMLHNAGLFDSIRDQLGIHISRLLLGEMIDVTETPVNDPLADAATNTLVGPSITPRNVNRPTRVTVAHDTGEEHIHWDELADEMQAERDPLEDLAMELGDDENIRALNQQMENLNRPTQPNEEQAAEEYEAYDSNSPAIPRPDNMPRIKAHFRQHHGMDIDMFKQMMGPQFREMTGGYDFDENPDLEEEIWVRMHDEVHNPEGPYANFMNWNHGHEDGPRVASRYAQAQPLDTHMEWLDLVLEHGLSVDQIPTDLHTHPTPMDEADLPAHILREHGYLPNTDALHPAHESLHDAHRMHFLFNNLNHEQDSE